MDIETLRNYCMQKMGVSESFPFNEDTLVFKVGGRMFLLISLQNPSVFNAKCDPERAVSLREEYEEITPGYHMSKVHWNTISMNGRLTISQLRELIDHSYELVYQKLPGKIKDTFKEENMKWQLRNDQLVRDFEFEDFLEAWVFMTRVAFLAEKLDHHPDWSNSYNKVQIRLSTHSAGNTVTEKDRNLAAEIDKLF